MAEITWDTGSLAKVPTGPAAPPAEGGARVAWDQPSSAPSTASTGSPDLIGRAKAAILSPLGGGDIPRTASGAPAGDARDPSFLRNSLGAIGRVMIPGSWEEIVTQAAMGIPGAGLGPTMLRTGASMAAPAAVAAMKGGDPASAAMQGGISGVVGGLTGGLSRAGTRAGASALSQDMPRLADTVGRFLPTGGGNPREIMGRIITGEARAGLQDAIDGAEAAAMSAITQPYVQVPSLAKLGIRGPVKGQPDFFEPREALTAIKSLERGLHSAGGDFSQGRRAVLDSMRLREARQQLETYLPPQAVTDLGTARRDFARGMEVIRLFSGGRSNVKPGQVEALVPEKKATQGALDWPTLQQNYQARRAKFSESANFTPDDVAALDAAMRYEPLRYDVSGKTPSAGISSYGPIPHPYMHGWFAAPRRTGGSEQAAGAAAGAGRQVGARAGSYALEQK